jgi:hypothetical protein
MRKKKKRTNTKVVRGLFQNKHWLFCFRWMTIVLIAISFGLIVKNLGLKSFVSSGASSTSYMSFYYNFYTTRYNKENKGEKWAEKRYNYDGKYEAFDDQIVLIHPGDYSDPRKLPTLLSAIMKCEPAVIGLDIIYDKKYSNIDDIHDDSQIIDSIDQKMIDVINSCGDKIVLAAEEKNNRIHTSYFFDAVSNSIELGSIYTPTIGLYKSEDLFGNDTILSFPYLLAKKYCKAYDTEIAKDDFVVNLRLFELSPIVLDSIIPSNILERKLRLHDLFRKVVIVGNLDLDVDRVILPCNLPDWTENGKVIQTQYTFGNSVSNKMNRRYTAMSGMANHAYAIRSLIRPCVSFKISQYNILFNIGIVSIYCLFYLIFFLFENRCLLTKNRKIGLGIRLFGQFFFLGFVIFACWIPFYITDIKNIVFDISLALFSLFFVRIGDTIFLMFHSNNNVSNKYKNEN